MNEEILKITKDITEKYLENNEIAEFYQYYIFYLMELSNFKIKDFPSEDEIKTYLMKNNLIEFDENEYIFWRKKQDYSQNIISDNDSLKDLFNYKVVISTNIVTSEKLLNNNVLKEEFKNILEIPNKSINLKGPFLTIDYEIESSYNEIKIKDTFFEITSYLIDNHAAFLDLYNYILKNKGLNKKQSEIFLLFSQISGAFNSYQKIRKTFSKIYKNSVSFMINEVKIIKL